MKGYWGMAALAGFLLGATGVALNYREDLAKAQEGRARAVHAANLAAQRLFIAERRCVKMGTAGDPAQSIWKCDAGIWMITETP